MKWADKSWRATIPVVIVLTLFSSVMSPRVSMANGGTVQLSSYPSGPYQLTVFTSPSPIRVGTVDVSVLVQRPGSNDVIQDAVVMVTAEGVGLAAPEEVYEATHEQATNKLYYAANVELPFEGRWRIGVLVIGEMGEGIASFEVEASRETLLEKPMALAVMILLPVLLVLGWIFLGGRRRSRS